MGAPPRDFVLKLRGSPDSLRAALKWLWRVHQLRCVALRTAPRIERRKPRLLKLRSRPSGSRAMFDYDRQAERRCGDLNSCLIVGCGEISDTFSKFCKRHRDPKARRGLVRRDILAERRAMPGLLESMGFKPARRTREAAAPAE